MSTRLYALLGHPVSHSLSPAMYTAAFQALGLDAEYHAFEVKPEDLARTLIDLHTKGYHGLNLTAPLKTVGAGLVENTTSLLGTPINTLVRTPTGWIGWNTDGSGLSDALEADLGVNLKGENVVLLGAGGAARSAAIECIQRGCASLWIGNRSSPPLSALVSYLKPLAQHTVIRTFRFDKLLPVFPKGSIVINATALGMKPDDPAPISLECAPAARVLDMVYAHDTSLLKQARALGLKCCDGRSMLLYQGVGALEIWMGRWMEKRVVDEMKKAISLDIPTPSDKM